jgi:hypothetical protein
MAGDYTRATFKPRKDYSGILMQQGRVTLDADWNELVDVLDRRLRAEIVDTLARCVTSKETPDAFLIAVTGGKLTIGAGRGYAHGLLVENHGADPLEYDAILGELRGTEPIDYEQQPYFPNAAGVAPLPTTGTYIAYLDAWRREVSYLEEPDLVEKAIGVDTSTRLQTAWQVRLLEAADGTTCDTEVPGWDALTAPSAGRLTTAAVGVPASTDPCTIPPTGGYRGTENRLYRIEIHEGGALGTATFKWSRDNASIASHVDTIDAARTELTLVRLGRDGVRRISVDDWVEVTDDWLELNGLPGELRKVAAVDEVKQSIALATPLTAGTFDATDSTRHTRVVRWDQQGAGVDAAGGLIALPSGGPASPIVLEDGVQISFDTVPAGGDFHAGDYWVFATRTADASVEVLTDEPPRGILHHYCRLGVVTFPDSVTDCRAQPPAGDDECGCDCTVCVTPESHATGTLTIQKAIDMVKSPGGKVCLQPGLYRLDEPVRIDGAGSVHLEGKGWKTILITSGSAPAIIVERSAGVIIDLLTIVTSTQALRTPTAAGIAIALVNTIGTVIERCVLVQLGLLQGNPPGDPGGGTPGQPGDPDPCAPENLKDHVSRGTITDLAGLFGPKSAGGPLIALDGLVLETLIDENVLVGTTGIGPVWAELGTGLAAAKSMDTGLAAGTADANAARYLITFDLAIEDNLMLCWLTGISLEGYSIQMSETRIRGNSLLVCLRAAIATTGLAAPGGRIDVRENQVRGLGYGIAAGTDDTRIVDNDVSLLRGLGTTGREGSLVSLTAALGSGVGTAALYLRLFGGDAIVLVPSLRPSGIDRCQIRGNRITDVVGNGIAIRTLVRSALVADNSVEHTGGGGVVMADKGSADVLAVERNQILNVGLLENTRTSVPVGVLLTQSGDVAVAHNIVKGVGLEASSAVARAGIVITGCETIRVADNTVTDVGPADEFLGLGAGIVVLDRFQRADVLDNCVRRAEAAPSGTPTSEWLGILIGSTAAVAGHGVTTGPLQTSYSVAGKQNLYRVVARLGRLVKAPLPRDSLAVRGNVVEAYGRAPAVLISTDGPCLFNDNRCFLHASEGVTTARLTAGAAVASNNYINGPRAISLDIQVPAAGPWTVLGNITSGPIAVDGTTPLPAPWQQLNIS